MFACGSKQYDSSDLAEKCSLASKLPTWDLIAPRRIQPAIPHQLIDKYSELAGDNLRIAWEEHISISIPTV